MSTKSLGLNAPVRSYLLDHANEPPLLTRLRTETQRFPEAELQISPEQGRFMGWVVSLMGARRCLEIGVFTGYSSLSVLLALPDTATLVACDVNEAWTNVARQYWAEAGVAGRVELRLGDARATLDSLIEDGQCGRFDFAFIDADKESLESYYERCLTLLRSGGVIAVDNALWSGRVANLDVRDAGTEAIRSLNARTRDDRRVDASLIPIGDGLLLLRKR